MSFHAIRGDIIIYIITYISVLTWLHVLLWYQGGHYRINYCRHFCMTFYGTRGDTYMIFLVQTFFTCRAIVGGTMGGGSLTLVYSYVLHVLPWYAVPGGNVHNYFMYSHFFTCPSMVHRYRGRHVHDYLMYSHFVLVLLWYAEPGGHVHDYFMYSHFVHVLLWYAEPGGHVHDYFMNSHFVHIRLWSAEPGGHVHDYFMCSHFLHVLMWSAAPCGQVQDHLA